MLACSDSVPDAPPAPVAVPLHGTEVVMDPLGGLAWPAQRLLVVADMHLEKGSSLARRGQMLPPYDTFDTLAHLEILVARWQPATVIALGDSLHDRRGAERLPTAARARLAVLQSGRSFVWIAGNHDPDPSPLLGGEWAREARIGALTFRHEPRPERAGHAPAEGEVAGHLHPAARLQVRGRSIRRRCFATDGRRMVLPALGAYAGGLNVRDPALSSLFPGRFEAHMLGRERTYRVEMRACLAD